MKLCTFHIQVCCILSLAILTLSSCTNKHPQQQIETQVSKGTNKTLPVNQAKPNELLPTQLPVRYQQPNFVTENVQADPAIILSNHQDYKLKVGANLTSNTPIPLRDILKKLAKAKKMNVSWANDVIQDKLVDVDIRANDDFFEAIKNLLRQVDYFYKLEGRTIIVKNKETKNFYISIPHMNSEYSISVGGDFLSGKNAASGTQGVAKIESTANKFALWDKIEENLKIILNIREQSEEYVSQAQLERSSEYAAKGSNTRIGTPGTTNINVNNSTPKNSAANANVSGKNEGKHTTKSIKTIRQSSINGDFYIINREVGLISITAKPTLLEKVSNYLATLKKELYRQVIIEAKIIEVYLKDNSKIGLDWSAVLKNFSLNGIVEFGTGGLLGQVYPQVDRPNKNGTPGYEPFLSRVSLSAAPFQVLLNALNEQGETRVLSNPKLTVLNGQPALLSVGKDIAYIKTVSKNVDPGPGSNSSISYTAEVDNVVEGVAMGVVASIIDDDSVILHLTPITTNLIDDTIEYRTFGDGLEVGLPKVAIREMSTMVKVKNGEMLIIGGLIDRIEGKTGDFAPILGDIPFIRYLFGVEEKRMEKRELVILLTTRVI